MIRSFNNYPDSNFIKKPIVQIVEVHSIKDSNKPPIYIIVDRYEQITKYQNDKIVEASIELEIKLVDEHFRYANGCICTFRGRYKKAFNNEEVSLTGGAVFLDPESLRGSRIGTYLMNTVVTWAQQWPAANVNRIGLNANQGKDFIERIRRNRFYTQFGIKFHFLDDDHASGYSLPMMVKELNTVSTWQKNITEINFEEYLAALIREKNIANINSESQLKQIVSLNKLIESMYNKPLVFFIKALYNKYTTLIWGIPILGIPLFQFFYLLSK